MFTTEYFLKYGHSHNCVVIKTTTFEKCKESDLNNLLHFKTVQLQTYIQI